MSLNWKSTNDLIQEEEQRRQTYKRNMYASFYGGVNNGHWYYYAYKQDKLKGGTKMVRKERVIDEQIKLLTKVLTDKIDTAVEFEKQNDEAIDEIKTQLKKLAKEPIYEDTLEGKIEEAKNEAAGKIETILKDLSLTTGIDFDVITLMQNPELALAIRKAKEDGGSRDMRGEPWSDSEDRNLARSFGLFLKDRARKHGRTEAAIRARVRHEILSEAY